MRFAITALIPALLAMGTSAGAAAEVPPGGTSDSLRLECEHGVTLALLGRPAVAESIFVWVLSRSPHDPRALTNLGNLALLQGDLDLATSYYDEAVAADSSDAGILLNGATVSMLRGDEADAQSRARVAVEMAGGPQAAGRLLGLRYQGAADSKGAERAYISKEELNALLQAAAGRIPKAPLPSAVPASPNPKAHGATAHKPGAPVWRSAGARAGDQDAAALVYWKR